MLQRVGVYMIVFSLFTSSVFADDKLIKWIKANISTVTNLPLSFSVPVESKKDIYQEMGESFSVPGIIERMIVEEGLNIYDGAVGQIVLALLGGEENLKLAYAPVKIYWNGRVGELDNIRAGFPLNSFIYDESNPSAVSSNLEDNGRRGFIFRIINAHGRYNTADPLDGKTQMKDFPTWPTVHWEDWKPIAGENAWAAMAALQLFHKKYYNAKRDYYEPMGDSIELQLAEELARAAMLLQADNGGIRMAPIGTHRSSSGVGDKEARDNSWWYNEIATENNLSWYAAFRMLYQITRKAEYKMALDRIEHYFKSAWNPGGNFLYQGAHFKKGRWVSNDDHFATDVQTWGIAVLGVEKLDAWFGEGAAFGMWKSAKQISGFYDKSGMLLGVGYTHENDRLSVEWTAGAILAARELDKFYRTEHPDWAAESNRDSQSMRLGIDILRHDLPDDKAAYSYSSRRGWIPFGWFSHDPKVLSLASTGWVIFVDENFNPFYLSKKSF